jgi:hypothetical protein
MADLNRSIGEDVEKRTRLIGWTSVKEMPNFTGVKAILLHMSLVELNAAILRRQLR